MIKGRWTASLKRGPYGSTTGVRNPTPAGIIMAENEERLRRTMMLYLVIISHGKDAGIYGADSIMFLTWKTVSMAEKDAAGAGLQALKTQIMATLGGRSNQ